MLKLYNTLTKSVTEFKPQNDVVKMYSCGPTVYSYAHIGNMRAYLLMDLLRRVLKYNDYKIEGVLNITDVGHLTDDSDDGQDKMELASKKENKTPWQIAEFYTDFFMSQASKLNIDMPQHIIKATDNIKNMINMITTLIENGYAYETSKGVYYDVLKFPDYGKLSGAKLDDKLSGARIEVDKEKRNPQDFTLWVKAPKEHIMQWESPWGMGYPGWHIECSAIGINTLGDTIDIHTGGIDHVPVHHENEIAQNYGTTHKHVVKRWMHVEFLQVNNGKMSKSLGNIYTIDDLEAKGYRALDFRYFCLNAHYSKKQNFTWEALDSAKVTLTRLYEQVLLHKNGQKKIDKAKIDLYRKEFEKAINYDLNAPLALSVLWKVVKDEPKSVDVYNLLLKFDKVLGLKLDQAENDKIIARLLKAQESIIPGDIAILAQKRWLAKKDKNYSEADRLRQQIFDLGYSIKDDKDSYTVSKL